MGTPYPLARTTRRITYKFQSNDVRSYIFSDAITRARSAVSRAGGQLLGGVFAPPKHIRRWCVNRSPHVNKKSREHFWMITHRRVFRWDAGSDVPLEAPHEISTMLPASLAVRVQQNVPGLQTVKGVFETLQKAQQTPTTRIDKKVQEEQ